MLHAPQQHFYYIGQQQPAGPHSMPGYGAGVAPAAPPPPRGESLMGAAPSNKQPPNESNHGHMQDLRGQFHFPPGPAVSPVTGENADSHYSASPLPGPPPRTASLAPYYDDNDDGGSDTFLTPPSSADIHGPGLTYEEFRAQHSAARASPNDNLSPDSQLRLRVANPFDEATNSQIGGLRPSDPREYSISSEGMQSPRSDLMEGVEEQGGNISQDWAVVDFNFNGGPDLGSGSDSRDAIAQNTLSPATSNTAQHEETVLENKSEPMGVYNGNPNKGKGRASAVPSWPTSGVSQYEPELETATTSAGAQMGANGFKEKGHGELVGATSDIAAREVGPTNPIMTMPQQTRITANPGLARISPVPDTFLRDRIAQQTITADAAAEVFASIQRERNARTVAPQLRAAHLHADSELQALVRKRQVWAPVFLARDTMEDARKAEARVQQKVAAQKATLDEFVKRLKDQSDSVVAMRKQQTTAQSHEAALKEMKQKLEAAMIHRSKLREINERLEENGGGAEKLELQRRLGEIRECLAEDQPKLKLGAVEATARYFAVIQWLFEMDKDYKDVVHDCNDLKEYEKYVQDYEAEVATQTAKMNA
ncbi:hypothetical protein HK405_003820 [Cladochytrium tenue]|nr:hypothetical protein HK405_003820 [Cladochytrium tenue]